VAAGAPGWSQLDGAGAGASQLDGGPPGCGPHPWSDGVLPHAGCGGGGAKVAAGSGGGDAVVGEKGPASGAGPDGGVSGRTRVSPWSPGCSTRVTSSGGPDGDVSAAVADGSVRLVPQEVQNAAPSGTDAPHWGQVWSVNCGLLDRAGHHLARRDPAAERASAGGAAGRGSPFERCPPKRAPAPRPGERRDAGVCCTVRLTVTGRRAPPRRAGNPWTCGRYVDRLSLSGAARP